MLLLTWHGTIVCLRQGGGGLVHLPFPLTDPTVAPLDLNPGQPRPEGEKQVHPALGSIAVYTSPRGAGISLTRYGRYLSAEREAAQMAFDRPAADGWESFLPLPQADFDALATLLSNRWIRASSRQMLRRSDIELLPEFGLRVGSDRFHLPDMLPLSEAGAPVERITLGTGAQALELVQARPGRSALVQTAQWPVRARRIAETLAVAVHRQLLGREPDQSEFEQDVAFLLERDGPAGLEDLIERRRPAEPEPAPPVPDTPPPEAARVRPQITQPVTALGTTCIVATTLRGIGLDQPPMPFDWLGTTPEMVLHCLQTDFAVLLDRSHYRSLTGQPAEGEPNDGCAHDFYAREYGVARVFNHNDPTRDADYRYTEACVERFRALLASPGPKLFVQVAEMSGAALDSFGALCDLLDQQTDGAMVVHIAVQPPDPGLSVPLISVVARRGPHVLYELQPLSRMNGERFLDASDSDLLERTVTAHAAAPDKRAAPPVPGLRERTAEIERTRTVHSVLLGWATREMTHWHRHVVDKAHSARRFHELNAETRWAFVYHFEDGGVRMDEKPAQAMPNEVQEDRALRYLQFFEAVARILPSDARISICVGVGDKIPFPEAIPIFCFQKKLGASSLLLPDIDFLLNDFYEAPAFQDTAPYSGKIAQAVFAGGTTGGLITPEIARNLSLPRLRAAAYFVGNPDVDFRLPKIVQCTTPQTEAMLLAQPFCQTEYLPWSEQLRRRFIISIDGNGATCSRVAISLLSTSVLLKYDSQDVLYYFGGLQPWLHYVPVAVDSDVAWIMAEEARNPAAFERIASNGRDFAKTYLSRSSAELYTALLLQLYAANLSDTPVGALRPAPKPPAKRVKRTSGSTHVVAHVQQRGDMPTRADGWTGLPESTLAIEGFSIFLGPELTGASIRTQVVLGNGNLSEIGLAGDYLGTRGDNSPILGFRIDVDDTAAALDISYEARFVDGTVIGPVPAGTLVQAAAPKVALEAFRVVITKL